MHKSSVLLGSLVAALGFSAAAQAAEVTVDAGRQVSTAARSEAATPRQVPAARPALKEIVSTFNPDPNFAYQSITGWRVSGADSIQGSEFRVAQLFTPDKDYLVRKITVAVSQVDGTPGATVSLNSDAGGVPGKSLYKARVSDLPIFGGCCVTATITAKPGVPVMANKPYWVVVHTDRATRDTFAVWNFNNIGATGKMAFEGGNGWFVVDSETYGAFSVMGW